VCPNQIQFVGRTFAVVSGIGGHKVTGFYDDLEANPWWAANAALDNGTDFGALYCTLNVNGVPGAAEVRQNPSFVLIANPTYFS
jgi:hypothetical protein